MITRRLDKTLPSYHIGATRYTPWLMIAPRWCEAEGVKLFFAKKLGENPRRHWPCSHQHHPLRSRLETRELFRRCLCPLHHAQPLE